MAEPTRVSQAALSRQISDLLRQIFEIDIKIQKFESTKTKLDKIPSLKAAKFSLQRDIVSLQINLELAKAASRRRRNQRN